MKTPPAGAKLAVEAVVACLQNKMKLTWDDCKKEMQKGGFVQSVLNFKPEGITEKLHHDITTNYIQNENWDLKKIARASGAAGPLAEWVESLLQFVKILHQIEPLQAEVRALEDEQNKSEQELAEARSVIEGLEQKLKAYKEDYSKLMKKVKEIKAQMEKSKDSCDRATELLNSLSGA